MFADPRLCVFVLKKGENVSVVQCDEETCRYCITLGGDFQNKSPACH